VTVGTSRPHPNDQRHFVERVSIFADDTLLASLLPHADSSPPGVSVRVTLNRDVQSIRAEVHCNLHGTWEARRPISVESDL
jgi:desulfoferrodoxin-like iron-binding protein